VPALYGDVPGLAQGDLLDASAHVGDADEERRRARIGRRDVHERRADRERDPERSPWSADRHRVHGISRRRRAC